MSLTFASPVAELIDKMIAKKVAAQIVAALGIATIPIIGHIAALFAASFLDFGILWCLGKTIIGGARIWVIANVDWEVKDVNEAKLALLDLLNNPEKYTAEQQAQIEKEFDEKAESLIHLANARIPV